MFDQLSNEQSEIVEEALIFYKYDHRGDHTINQEVDELLEELQP